MKTCTYQVCHMVPEQRVKTCSYKVCHMVPETCVKQVPYTVCKPVCYTKTINCSQLGAEAGAVHGNALRAGGVQEVPVQVCCPMPPCCNCCPACPAAQPLRLPRRAAAEANRAGAQAFLLIEESLVLESAARSNRSGRRLPLHRLSFRQDPRFSSGRTG